MLMLVLAVAIIGLVFATVQMQRVRDAWASAGAELGLEMRKANRFSKPTLHGMIDGIDIEITTRNGGDNDTRYTRYKVRHQPVGPPVTMKRQTMLSRFGQLFGKTDIEIGDPFFDDRVVINTPHARAMRPFLSPTRQAAVLEIFERYKNCEVTQNSITAETTRIETDPRALVGTARRLVDIAKVLGDPFEVDQALSRQYEGSIADARELLHDLNERESNTFVETLEAEALIELGDHAQAADVLETVDRHLLDAMPTDGWETLAAKPAPVLLPARPVEAESAGAQQAVIDDLFRGDRLSYEIVEVFEQQYAGKSVAWSGPVVRYNTYRHDSDFGAGPGVKAKLLLGGSGSSTLISNEVHAVIELPAETGLVRDEEISFKGTLVRVDRFARTVYIAKADLA